MHADGLRLFVDVGARGNLAGFVEDILRGKPAFAVAANLPAPQRSDPVESPGRRALRPGRSLEADYLYARRRPRAIDWNAPEPPPRATVELTIGFPEMRLSDALVARLRSAPHDQPAPEHHDDRAPLRTRRSAADRRRELEHPRETAARATTTTSRMPPRPLSPPSRARARSKS